MTALGIDLFLTYFLKKILDSFKHKSMLKSPKMQIPLLIESILVIFSTSTTKKFDWLALINFIWNSRCYFIWSLTSSVSVSITPENLIVINLSLRFQTDSPKIQIFLGSFIENQILSKIFREKETCFDYLCITLNISRLISLKILGTRTVISLTNICAE